MSEKQLLLTHIRVRSSTITDYDNPGSISFESKNTAIADVTQLVMTARLQVIRLVLLISLLRRVTLHQYVSFM